MNRTLILSIFLSSCMGIAVAQEERPQPEREMPQRGMQRERTPVDTSANADSNELARRQALGSRLRQLVGAGKITGAEARELIEIAFPKVQGSNGGGQPERSRAARRGLLEVKKPEDFKKLQEKTIFSGPQPGEALPAFVAHRATGDQANEPVDLTQLAGDKAQVLIFQDNTGVALRGLVGFSRTLDKIREKSGKELNTSVVFLGDDPTELTEMAGRLAPHAGKSFVMTVSPDGRDGPGNYGLNRNVAMTVLLAKDGKVLHNFALTQGMLAPDPYVLGGVAELLELNPEELASWLNEPQPEANMRRGR